MAKRVPAGEQPYRPVDEALVRAVLGSGACVAHPAQVAEEDHAGETKEVGVAEAGADEGPTNVVVMPSRQPEAADAEAPQSPSPKLMREKRVLLALAEERDIERLVDRIADEVSTPVKLSHVLRACMTILCHAEEEILKKARQAPPLTRPPNGDPLALIQFEHELARIVSAGLRNAPPLR